jgi:hypothetical protein
MSNNDVAISVGLIVPPSLAPTGFSLIRPRQQPSFALRRFQMAPSACRFGPDSCNQ